jgi:superfamily II DNA or RNA helicase
MSILRPYQRQAVEAFWAALSPEVNRVAIEMATGLGKTITFAGVIDEWLRGVDGTGESMATHGDRALVLVERDELVRQAVQKIQAVSRGRWQIGVVKATRNEVAADIVVASVPTLRQFGRKEQITDVGLIVVDECHHAVAKSYVDILSYYDGMGWPCTCGALENGCGHSHGCRYWKPSVPVLGVTATLSRADGQGLGRIFQELAFSRSLTWGIRKGFLIDLVPYTIKIPEVDAGASDAELDAVLCEGIAPEVVVDAWLEKVDLSGGTADEDLYKPNISTVLFAPLVRSAQAFADAFNAVGVKAEVVAGAYPDAHNDAVEARFRAGVTTVVCNAMKWTEGLDIPRISCVIVARPTKSVELLTQMVGRGLRPWLDAEAPPREEQRCILLAVQGTASNLATVADLSEHIGDVRDGVSLTEMEDQWDIGAGIESEPEMYRGPVRVEQWDALVQQSSKAWNYTEGGVPYLPTAKRSRGYVFVTPVGDHWTVWAREPNAPQSLRGAFRTTPYATAPDLELAMALAEDAAQERGGDIGALIADKARAWRKGMPSAEMQDHARRLGLEPEMVKIMAQRAAGKAGKLSDLISKVEASRVLDPVALKIKERG